MSNSRGNEDICLIDYVVFVCMRCVLIKEWREWLASSQNLEANGITFENGIDCRKPLPLTTVELQKQGARFLGMSSANIMKVSTSLKVSLTKVAENLYTKGFISYPRTETDQFDPGMNLRALVEKQINDQTWGN